MDEELLVLAWKTHTCITIHDKYLQQWEDDFMSVRMMFTGKTHTCINIYISWVYTYFRSAGRTHTLLLHVFNI